MLVMMTPQKLRMKSPKVRMPPMRLGQIQQVMLTPLLMLTILLMKEEKCLLSVEVEEGLVWGQFQQLNQVQRKDPY